MRNLAPLAARDADPAATGSRGVLGGALLLAIALWSPMVLLRSAWPVDETRYADVALAMRESGQWWVPVLHQKWYFEKPPGFFWAIAGLARLGVPIDRGPQFVSLLASLGTLLLLPSIGRSCGLSGTAVRRGAFVLITAPLFAAYAQLGYLDPLLAFELCAAFACAARRTVLPHERRGSRVGLALLEGVLLAAGLLTKGPVVLLFAIGWRIGASVARRDPDAPAAPRPASFAWLDLLVLASAVGLALAWTAKAQSIAGASYVHDLTFGQLERRVAGTERKHHRFPGYALLIALAGMLPWSLLAIGALPRPARAWWRPPPRQAALLGFGLLPTVLIALLPTQQPHYILPALPALALLAGEALAAPPRRAASRSIGALAGLLALALLAAAIALPFGVPLGDAVDAEALEAIERDPLLLGGIVVGAAALVALLVQAARDAGAPPLRRTLLGSIVVLSLMPLVAWRADPIFGARELLDAPPIRAAKRIVAPTGLRCALRLVTGLPLIEEYDGRKPLRLLGEDPALIAILWEDELARFGLVGSGRVVARGHLQGRALVALRGGP
ncbi:MAG: phospholipid carrier-dependent glycosyltransferase [Planctomycetes bacterium]|nr:phospholipid carrier-dependent glycosyltransferase [Planctomycetota bacterium]